jgi:ubiquinone/menaquinone biosynthesis C-methylase UbiE
MTSQTYPLEGQASELDRLQLQSLVWEPAGRRLLHRLGPGDGGRAIDVGCGALGWLRLLSDWVGTEGQVIGTDINDDMLNAAGRLVAAEGLDNVTLVRDDLFASELEPSSFDLVHARFLIGPLARGHEQLAAHLRLARPGATIVLEELDPLSWHFVPTAPALGIDPTRPMDTQLIPLIKRAFDAAGGDTEAFKTQLEVFQRVGIQPEVRAEVQALPPGHPYLSLPLQFAAALDGLLRSMVEPDDLDAILRQAEAELNDPHRWGITFTLTQCWGQRRS